MPDSRESTLPSPARKPGRTVPQPDRPDRVRSGADAGVAATRSALRAAAAELRAVSRRLAALAERLPLPGRAPDPAADPAAGNVAAGRGGGQGPRPSNRRWMLGELRSAADCVRADLLADAIETLEAVGTMTDDELRRRRAERRRILVL